MNDDATRIPPHEPPTSVEEALEQARFHAQSAAAESAAALAALLDAATLAATGRAAHETPAAGLGHGLDALRRWVEPDSVRDGASLLRAVANALDVEIRRWEERSQSEPDARSVLRAFLGLRELLWELGVRPSEQEDDPSDLQEAPKEPVPRVQKIAVEG
ncbi:MAG: hypothetical protein GY723_00290 [bacterium]|nr:hypothetical protein [bacterium]